MKCLRALWFTLQQLILIADCFAPPILLRYQSAIKKKTKTGGCLSILVILILLGFFATQLNSLLNKQQMNSENFILRDLDPSRRQVTRQDFMFTIGMIGVDIFNQESRYFDIIVTEQTRINTTYSSSDIIQMVPCEKQSFEKYGADIEAIFDNLQLYNALCLPPNFKVNITGKWASQEFRYLRIHIKRCHGQGCLDDTQFENYLKLNGAFYINYYFINKLINPTKLKPISVYFEDKNYNMVNDKIAIDTNLYLSEYSVETDESLWPWEEKNVTSGVYVDRTQKEQFIHPAQNGSYAQFHIRKSDQKMVIKRSFRRIDDLLSYIGGLFGIFASVFGVLIFHYNQCCFEIQMCSRIFSLEKNDKQQVTYNSEGNETASNFLHQQKVSQIEQKNNEFTFTIFSYLKYLIFYPIHLINPDFKWQSAQRIFDRIQQSRNQMNLDILLQKISFYDRAFQCLFDQDQIMLLYLQEKISLKDLKQQRAFMALHTKTLQLHSCNEVANDFITKDFKNKKNSHNLNKTPSQKSLELILQELIDNENYDIRNTLALRNIGQEMIIRNFHGEIQVTQQIGQAFQRVCKKSEDDQVCRKILSGIHPQLLQKYYRYQEKQEKDEELSFKKDQTMPKSHRYLQMGHCLNNNQFMGIINQSNKSQGQRHFEYRNDRNKYRIQVIDRMKTPRMPKVYDIESLKNIQK